MSQRLKRNGTFLAFILDKNTKQNQVKKITECLSTDQVLVLCEVLHNILHGILSLGRKEIATLKRTKATLRKIVDKKTSVSQKRKLLQTHSLLILKVISKFRANILARLKCSR